MQTSEIKLTAYKHVPSTYVICEKDQAAPYQYQEMFAGAAGAKIIKLFRGSHADVKSVRFTRSKVTESIREAEKQTQERSR
jgi:hypothetical protein